MSVERTCSHEVTQAEFSETPLNSVVKITANTAFICELRVFTKNASCSSPNGDEKGCPLAQFERGEIKLEDIKISA